MVDIRPFIPLVLGSWLLWLAWRAIRKREVKGEKGEAQDIKRLSFYRITFGYAIGGLVLIAMGLVVLHQTYGMEGVAGMLVLIVGVFVLIWQAGNIKRGLLEALKKPFQRKEKIEIAPTARNWALAAGAVQARIKGWDIDSIDGGNNGPLQQKAARRLLRREWEIKNEDDWEETIEWLFQEGHRQEFQQSIQRLSHLDEGGYEAYIEKLRTGENQALNKEELEEEINRVEMVRDNRHDVRFLSFMAWDMLRLIELCRLGLIASYVEEAEAWKKLTSTAQILQSRYDSWSQMANSYLFAREFWSGVEMKRDGAVYEKAIQNLLTDPNSPWNLLEWEQSLYKRK